MLKLASLLLLLLSSVLLSAQNPPWERPLKSAWSSDGITFDDPEIFQDSAGVPCVIKWGGDTLVSVFQWFRQPVNSPTWDRVAVKFSYDNAQTWSEPVPIFVIGFPQNYQRPFDPTLAVLPDHRLRIYFSSSEGVPQGGLDSTINTYSAVSEDGINYTFENGARVDELHRQVIDPAVIQFFPGWHYASPKGAPQEGAFHYVSPDGFNFSKVIDIPSDPQHNWTGNYMVNSPTELRFYGSGSSIWFNSSVNGGIWNGYINTNINGGDPGVVLVSLGSYYMVYTGPPYVTGGDEGRDTEEKPMLFPNPASTEMMLTENQSQEVYLFNIVTLNGNIIQRGIVIKGKIDVSQLKAGLYFLELIHPSEMSKSKIIKFMKN